VEDVDAEDVDAKHAAAEPPVEGDEGPRGEVE
jgi:hypothetical protein